MGKVIRHDFRKERRREMQALWAFEANMAKLQKKQQFRLAFSLVAFSFVLIGIMLLPLALSELSQFIYK